MRVTATLLAALVIGATSVYGQKAVKPNLGKIESLIRKGEFQEAKELTDIATTYEKTKDDPKTYYLRGLVYLSLDTMDALSASTSHLETAMANFTKSDELIKDDKELFTTTLDGFPDFKSKQIMRYWAFYYNKAANEFAANNYAASVGFFDRASLVDPQDTNAVVNGGYAAVQAKMYDEAKGNFYKAIEMGVVDKDMRLLLVYIVAEVQGDLQEGLEIVTEARLLYPQDNELARQEINFLIKLDRAEEATENLMSAIQKEPNDPNLYFTLGILHEEIMAKLDSVEQKAKRLQLALEAYQNAVKADPNYYNAHYNIGVIYITDAQTIIKEQNSLGYSKEDLKKADGMEPIIQEKLSAALPIWEKIVSLNPDEIPALETLSYLYTMQKMYDKAEAIKDKIDNLREN
jgi:tetratricopeptide (TPR) repeat protein